jgi:hypothetical protein
MSLINDQYILRDKDIPLKMNPVLAVDLRPPMHYAVVLDYNDRITLRGSRSAYTNGGILFDAHAIADCDPMSSGPVE